jgi:hypothetical protein
VSREFATKIGDLFGSFFSGDSGDFLVRGGKGGFSMSWRDSADVFETQLMLKMEVGTMTTMLIKKAGFNVDVASSSGQPLAGQHEKIEKVMRLSEIKLDDYMGIIIPCLNIRKGTVTPEAEGVGSSSFIIWSTSDGRSQILRRVRLIAMG